MRRAAVLALALLGAGCTDDATPAPEASEAVQTPAQATGAGGQAAMPPLPGPSDKDPAALLAYWKAAVEAHDMDAAAKAWQEGTTRAAIDRTDLTVTFGKGREEGAAGSLYFTVPVTFTAIGPDGESLDRMATLTARRVNDVSGASAEQLSWRIASLESE